MSSRWTFLSLIALGAVAVARCSGGGSGPPDTGADVRDVAIEYFVPETTPPAPIIRDVVAGAQHTCIVVDYNAVNATFCFGPDSAVGAPKNGAVVVTTSNGRDPVMQPSFQAISASHGSGTTCAVDQQKQVYCWGDNSLGQCGQGNVNSPVTVPTLATDFEFGVAKTDVPPILSVGSNTVCNVRVLDHKLECFGDNSACQADLYDDGGTCASSPLTDTATTDTEQVFTNVTTLSVGLHHGCAAAMPSPSGAVGLFCWGDNTSFESAASGAGVPAQQPISGMGTIAQVATGDDYTCFVTASPVALFCFGKNDVHQASPSSANATIKPVLLTAITLPSMNPVVAVAAGANETCGTDTNGDLFCWGNGHGTNIDKIAGVKDVGKVVLGAGHKCLIGHLSSAMTTDPSAVICWGDNTNEQCGQPGGGTVSSPTVVAFPQTAP